MKKFKFSSNNKEKLDGRGGFLPRASMFFYERSKFTIVLWAVLVVFGIASYTTLMQRQGFPAVQAPYSLISGTYLVDDAKKVDTDVTGPVSKLLVDKSNIKSVTTNARANTFDVFIQYTTGTEPKAASLEVEKIITDSGKVVSAAQLSYQTIDVTKYTTATGKSYDAMIAVYADGKSIDELTAKAQDITDQLKAKKLSTAESFEVVSPFSEGTNPATGQVSKVQTSFEHFGYSQDKKAKFSESVLIGLKAKANTDTIKLYGQVKKALSQVNSSATNSGYTTSVAAAFGPAIQQEISELQKTLLEGLVAVLLVGTILIALRASLLTILSMITVITITLGVLYAVGYTLNVITLFALILGLSLVVDDTIIMVEALDVERKRHKNAKDIVHAATKKVSLAMVAATSTAMLGFAPLLFVGGILGGFIRAIPVTIIVSLLVSLIVALTIIPLLARKLILQDSHIGEGISDPLPVRIQEGIAHKITAPLRWTHHARKRLWIVGVSAVVLGIGFIAAGGYMFKFVKFDIFPSDKDSNNLQITLSYPNGTDIETAKAAATSAEAIIGEQLGKNFKQASYYGSGTERGATMVIDLTPYDSRSITAPQMVDRLKSAFAKFSGASVDISQQGAGGPAGTFGVQIQTDDRQAAIKLSNDMAGFLAGKELKRLDGTTAKITHATAADPLSVSRKDNKQYIAVSASFDGTDTSTLVALAKDLVNKEYTSDKLKTFGLESSNIVYDFGFEDENQQSFSSMAKAFPILLAVIFIVLAFEFRSLLQPLIIFMAIPFSFFGITGGLWLTHNPFSFFTLLGCFALIGLSIKNTILLTDYANQGRKAGMGRVDAIAYAVEERFRPLIATSATAVVSLLPLALFSPFWESLAYALIFGLLASTTLVILIFPYYYLGGEYLRMKISRKAFFVWLIASIAIVAVLSSVAGIKQSAAMLIVFGLTILRLVIVKIRNRRK